MTASISSSYIHLLFTSKWQLIYQWWCNHQRVVIIGICLSWNNETLTSSLNTARQSGVFLCPRPIDAKGRGKATENDEHQIKRSDADQEKLLLQCRIGNNVTCPTIWSDLWLKGDILIKFKRNNSGTALSKFDVFTQLTTQTNVHHESTLNIWQACRMTVCEYTCRIAYLSTSAVFAIYQVNHIELIERGTR